LGNRPFERALERSAMPVLARTIARRKNRPSDFLMRNIHSQKSAIHVKGRSRGSSLRSSESRRRECRSGFGRSFARGNRFFQYPVEPVRRAIARVKSEGANAIVLTGHMGLKPRSGGRRFCEYRDGFDFGISRGGSVHRRAIPIRRFRVASRMARSSRKRTISEFTWDVSIFSLIAIPGSCCIGRRFAS